MSYLGKTYAIPCERGGFSGDQNTDAVKPEMFVSPSRNVNTHRGGRETRGGTAKVNGTAVSGAPRIMGLVDFILRNGTQFQVFAANDGKVYKNTTTTIKTGMSTANFFSLVVFQDYVYITDESSTPQKWDGAAAATSNLTSQAADWTANKPFMFLKHGRGASERLWAFTRLAAYYGPLNSDDFGGAGSGKITIDTGDGNGIIGALEVGNEIIVFGTQFAFRIDDSSPSTSAWGYTKAQWTGGLANFRLAVKTPTDVICMDDVGNIYSIAATNDFGDYIAASLTRPAKIDYWIANNVDLTKIANFHAIYDRSRRAVLFFMVRTGQTTIDECLAYFIDRPPEEAWSIMDNQSFNSGYSASCAAEVRVSAGSYLVYTGDYSGFLWKTEQATFSDDGNPYYNGFRTPPLNFGDSRVRKQFKRGYVLAKTVGDYSLQVKMWVDGVALTSTTISLSGTGGVLGSTPGVSFTLGSATLGILGGSEFVDRFFSINTVGKRIQFEFYLNTVGQHFFVSQVLIDFRVLGVRP